MRHKDQSLMNSIRNYVNESRRCSGKTPSLQDIAGTLNVGKTTVYRYLHEMDEKGLLKYDAGSIRMENANDFRDRLCSAPIVGSIPCGSPTEEEEEVEAYIPLPRSLIGQGDIFILRASGDSMSGANINDGDLVIIRRQETAEPGAIIAALIDEHESSLKRLCFDDHGNPYLHPENSSYSDIYPENGLRIQGVATTVIKQLEPKA